jgi:hypothetical protein
MSHPKLEQDRLFVAVGTLVSLRRVLAGSVALIGFGADSRVGRWFAEEKPLLPMIHPCAM